MLRHIVMWKFRPGTEAEQSSRPPVVKSAALVLVPPLSNPR